MDELQVPLSYFRDLSVITTKIGMDSIYSNEKSADKDLEMEYDLYSEELSNIIKRIFECILFFRSHVGFLFLLFFLISSLPTRIVRIISKSILHY